MANRKSMNNVTCFISKRSMDAQEAKRGEDLQPALLRLIQKDYPEFDKDAWISIEALNKYRKLYLVNLIIGEQGDLGRLEADAIDSIANNRILSENVEEDIEEKSSLEQRMADRIAAFGGSWVFIGIFFAFIFAWLLINSVFRAVFDPYPYILLNLILSCVAAIQAPIIMMSQNRQEQKDRLRSEHDYKINLKAELEIKMLHEKMDHLMINQSSRLLEIQQIQAEYLEDILDKLESKR